MKQPTIVLGAILVLMAIALVASNVGALDRYGSQMSSKQVARNIENKVILPSEKALNDLKTKASANITEGWFYMRDYVQYDVDAPTEEGVIPLTDNRSESWFYINSLGMVEKSISIERTMDGQISQVGIFSNNTSWNTMVDEVIPATPYMFEPFDYGLSYHIKYPNLKSEKTDKDGKKVLKFKIKHVEMKPLKMLDLSKKLLSMEYEFIFDDTTGFIISVRNIAALEDGSYREFMYVQIEEIRFNSEPPSDVLEYFTMKENREAQP